MKSIWSKRWVKPDTRDHQIQTGGLEMTARWRKIITTIPIMLFMLSACMPLPSQAAPTAVLETKAITQETKLPTSKVKPTQTTIPLQASGGPFLLLQSGVGAYSIINFADVSISPFDPPGPAQHYNLAENRSPSGTQMLFPVREGETQVYSFITGKTHTTYYHESDSSIFSPDTAAAAAREALPGLKYSDEALLSAVKNAFLQSISRIQWFQSDRYRLSVLPSGPASTQLTLDDHQTGMREALEELPALVEDYWVGPSGERILLKKGYMFEPGVWQDDRYYLVDVRKKQAEPIFLPQDADNPRVFWFSQGKVGVIHQPALSGGVNFSLVNVETHSQNLILSGPFDGLKPFGKLILTLRQDQEADTTTLTLWNQDGQVTQTQEIKGICFFSASLSEKMTAMNCGLESVLVETQDDNLTVKPFREALFLLAPSPEGRFYILVTQKSTTILLNYALQEVETLQLEAPPLEIRWLPDSSGFLYRTAGSLYLYQTTTKTDTFLIESDLFGDYRNLNAVWIQLGE